MRTHLFVLALASSPFLAAQDKVSPFRCVPADSDFVLRLAAPAKWKQQFAGTQVAKLFAGETLTPLIGAMTEQWEQAITAVRESGEFDADLLEKLVTAYGGDMVIAGSVDFASIPAAMEGGDMPHFGVVISMTPDGTYDFQKLAAAIQKSAEEDASGDVSWRDLQVGEVKMRCTTNEDEPNTTLPVVVDGHLVMLVSDDIEKFAAKALGTGARFTAAADSRALFLRANLGPMMKTIIEVAGEQLADRAPMDIAALMSSLGLNSLDSLSMSIGAEGKHLAGDMSLELTEGNQGLFGAMTAGLGAPKMLRYVPASSETFSVSAFDFGALLRTVAQVWTGLGDSVPMTWEQAQTQFAEQLKVRLKEDLFDHLGSEMLMLQDVEAQMAAMATGEDPEDPLGGINGTCVGVALRDGKAFGESLEKLVRSRGLHAGRKTEEYQGTKVHRLRLAAVVEIEYAVTDDMLLVGLGSGEASRASLRAILDARATPAAAGEAPKVAKAALAVLPADWTGVSTMSVSGFFSGFADGFGPAFAMSSGMDLPEEVQGMLEAMKGLAGDLKRCELETLVSTSYTTARSVVIRYLW